MVGTDRRAVRNARHMSRRARRSRPIIGHVFTYEMAWLLKTCRRSSVLNLVADSLRHLRISASSVTLFPLLLMNPDKLFDYLDGRLPAAERAALEEQLMSDKQLQREFAVARQIHAGMRGESREVVLPAPADLPEQGRKTGIRIGVAFMVLMFVNIGIGLYFIFWHESKNPNSPLLEAQMREQIAKSIGRAT